MYNYIKELIKQGEHQQLDFKFEISDAKKIARSMVAFTNTDGGTLLIGVKDNGKISGIRSDEEYYMVESAAGLYCKPPVPFTAKSWNIDGKTILEVTIPKGNLLHSAPDLSNKYMVYVRSKDENRLANPVILKLWSRKNKPSGTFIKYSEKERKLLTHLKDKGPVSLNQVKKITGSSKYVAENILVNLLAIDLIKYSFTEKGIVYQLVNNQPYFNEDTLG